jgi:hypothetical protein
MNLYLRECAESGKTLSMKWGYQHNSHRLMSPTRPTRRLCLLQRDSYLGRLISRLPPIRCNFSFRWNGTRVGGKSSPCPVDARDRNTPSRVILARPNCTEVRFHEDYDQGPTRMTRGPM